MFGRKSSPRLIPPEKLAGGDYAAVLDEIQAPVTEFLKSRGFRRSRRTYNRRGVDGLVQVVNFQAGAYPLGGVEIPGLRGNLWGRFTINLALVVPEMVACESGSKPRKSYTEAHGMFRARLGSPAAPAREVWWKIERPAEPIAAELIERLTTVGLPLLESVDDRPALLRYYERHGRFPDISTARSALNAAVVAYSLGEHDQARGYFQRAREEGTGAAFSAHVTRIEAACRAGAARS